MADLRIVDAPVLLQESITDDVKMPTGGLGNFSIRLGDIVWYVVTKEQLANKNYVDLSSKGVKDKLDAHIADKNNPHNVTKAQVGLGSVDNTADIDKPVSNAVRSAIITATTDMATKTYVNSKDGDLSTLTTTDKTSLVKAINEVNDATKGVVEIYNKNTAGANGWTTDLVVENGLTQKQINAQVAVKFIKASEAGLTKWAEFKKPPYTLTEYKQAYDNGVNLTNAIKAANDAGYNSVVLERGNYPFTYTTANTNNQGVVKVKNVNNMDVDLNGSTLFAIYDSDNRSPYDTSSNAIYQLGGAIMRLEHSAHTTIRNGIFRGEHYNRSYTNAGEKQTENTTGLFYGDNVRYSKVLNCEFHGFRADGLCALSDGIDIIGGALTNTWYAGGLDSTGNEVTQAGSYRTSKLDLQGKTIYNNAVNLSKYGYLRAAKFRSEFLLVGFFDANSVFISSEMVTETQDIILPTGTRYVQFVAYNDERTDATVKYGDYIGLATGQSRYALVEQCKFYRNMRGCISNFVDNAIIRQCTFSDSGVKKSEIPIYSSNTLYGINYEDVYVGKFTVDNCVFDNLSYGVLGDGREFAVVNSTFKNMRMNAINSYNCAKVNITGNYFYGVSLGVYDITYRSTYLKTYCVFNNNIAVNCGSGGTGGTYNSNFVYRHYNNYYYGTGVKLFDGGEGRSIYTHDNVYVDMSNVSVYAAQFFNCASVHNEQVIDTLTTNNEYLIKSFDTDKVAHNNIIKSMTDFTAGQLQANRKSVIKNVEYTALNASGVRAKIYNLQWDASVNTSLINDVLIDSCSFTNVAPSLGFHKANTNPLPVMLYFNKCKFSGLSWLRDQTVTDLSNTNSYSLTVTFNQCDLDLSAISTLITTDNAFPVNINLIDCRIYASSTKSVRLVNKARSNVVITLDNCTVKNIIFTDPVINYARQAKVVYDPPSLATATQQSTTVTLTGAKLGDNINVSFSQPMQGTRMWGEVTAVDTVTVYHRNDTGVTVDLPSGNLTIKIV